MIIKTPIWLFEWVRNGQQEVAKQKGLNHIDNPMDLLEGCKYIHTRARTIQDMLLISKHALFINSHMS